MAKKLKNNPDEPTLDMGFDQLEAVSQQESGPVTVLGMTFTNEEERRAYFREQLRAKLPDLRKIEGFPIGSDDDIINLSDPPYYTACPNPWLNDFIAEWEQEKLQLEAEGKRFSNFVVNEPYAYGVKAGKNSAIYNAHSYHTKVPFEVIMRYILHYTQPGDIVLDNFGGTGMTAVAAAQCSEYNVEINNDFRENHLPKPNYGTRHAICGDLSPLCFHIASNYNRAIEVKSLESAVNSILSNLEDCYGDIYKIRIGNTDYHINYFVWSQIVSCSGCGEELNVHDLSFDYQTTTLHTELVCPNCGLHQKKNKAETLWESTFDEFSMESNQQLRYSCCLLNYSIPGKGRGQSRIIPTRQLESIKTFIPTDIIGDGYNKTQLSQTGCKRVYQIYPNRTLHVLAYLYDLIHTKYADMKNELMFIFTSMLPKLTRLNRYMPQHGSRALVGPMANVLYLPPQYVENNPIDQFEYQAKKIIKAYAQIKNGSLIQIASATKSSIKDNSIDYIFTDPPFGANIMYSELNFITESWLKIKTNDEPEAVSNSFRGKGYFEYQSLMTESFKEYYRVLKPGKWMTVEFSNSSAAFWNCLQNSIINAGFIIASVTDLNKERSGLFGMIGPTAVKQDLALSCYKPDFIDSSNTSFSQNSIDIWDFVTQLLEHLPIHLNKDNRTTSIIERNPKILYDRLISYFVQKNVQIPIDSCEFRKGLAERFLERDGMYFIPSQAVKYDELRKSTQGFQGNLFFVDSEQGGIGWLNNELTKPQTYQSIYPNWIRAIQGVRKGDILPELKQILEENFILESDGKWRKPNLQDDVDLAALRLKALMREFKIYVEVAKKPRGKIKEARVEALRVGFKQCYQDKDFATIIAVGDRIPQNLLTEDEQLLQFYEIASSRV